MVVIIIMGVCGSGKTSVGEMLSEKLHWPFEDGDKWHSEENVMKMSNGLPLTDVDRIPWLQKLHTIISQWVNNNINGILACSALKQSYREILVGETGYRKRSQGHCVLLLLHGPIELISSRMKERRDHFMPDSLLQSQIDTMELPTHKETYIECDLLKPINEIVEDVIEKLKEFL